MKTNLFLIALGLLVFASCKSDDPEPDTEVIRESINSIYRIGDGEVYTQDLGVIDLTDVTISTAPKNASLSEITTENTRLTYSYQPTAGYLGNDTVSIETCVAYEDGACINYIDYNIFFEVIEPVQFTIVGDTCASLVIQEDIGSSFTETLAALETLRPENFGNISYNIVETEITVNNPIVNRTYTAITFTRASNGEEIFTIDVIDSEGTHFGITNCQ